MVGEAWLHTAAEHQMMKLLGVLLMINYRSSHKLYLYSSSVIQVLNNVVLNLGGLLGYFASLNTVV